MSLFETYQKGLGVNKIDLLVIRSGLLKPPIEISTRVAIIMSYRKNCFKRNENLWSNNHSLFSANTPVVHGDNFPQLFVDHENLEGLTKLVALRFLFSRMTDLLILFLSATGDNSSLARMNFRVSFYIAIKVIKSTVWLGPITANGEPTGVQWRQVQYICGPCINRQMLATGKQFQWIKHQLFKLVCSTRNFTVSKLHCPIKVVKAVDLHLKMLPPRFLLLSSTGV